MKILKAKEWKINKDNLPQFEPIVFDKKYDLEWSEDDDGYKLLSSKSNIIINRVKRLKDGYFFSSLEILYKEADSLEIVEFHKDLIHVTYCIGEFEGVIEINDINVTGKSFFGLS